MRKREKQKQKIAVVEAVQLLRNIYSKRCICPIIRSTWFKKNIIRAMAEWMAMTKMGSMVWLVASRIDTYVNETILWD